MTQIIWDFTKFHHIIGGIIKGLSIDHVIYVSSIIILLWYLSTISYKCANHIFYNYVVFLLTNESELIFNSPRV